ncbi:hypothetical protein ATANTOWER_018648 [Ataeniobius toweri]|uniref:Uncharacterized protein n=1 Tax=Ataeniobius toweri TaxID=208326 RepID=A0ABU7AHW3_9TELE|nr:hypothetical protein [Ataeniobius toweri]
MNRNQLFIADYSDLYNISEPYGAEVLIMADLLTDLHRQLNKMKHSGLFITTLSLHNMSGLQLPSGWVVLLVFRWKHFLSGCDQKKAASFRKLNPVRLSVDTQSLYRL